MEAVFSVSVHTCLMTQGDLNAVLNFHSVFDLFCYLPLHTPVSLRCVQIFADKVMLM